VFSGESGTVVSEASDRRDARSAGREAEGAGAAAGARSGRRSAFDLPPLDEPKRSDDGGLVN
jgi:hypothetical protein